LWDALSKTYSDIGFDNLGDEVFKQLVLARIIEPTSKETLINDLNKNPDWKYFCFFEPVTAKTRKRLLF
jgi:hypothetical protein